MPKKILILATLAIAVAAILGFVYRNYSGEVKIVHAQMMPAVQAVYATGTVEAVKMVSISPRVSARLLSLEVDENAVVEAGQVLAKLENTDVLQNVENLDAKLELAKKALARAQTLAKSGAISKESFDQAQAAYKSANAALEQAKAQLSYLQLIAPEKGTVIRRDGEIGEMMAIGTPVFWINSGDEIRIETEVDEEDIGLVSVDKKVLIGADAFPDQIFNGHVESITPKGDPVARSYRVRISIDGQTPLMIGMTTETNIITQEKDSALMIPLTAFKNGQVIAVKNAKAQEVVVKTGIKTSQEIEILSGIEKEDAIAQVYDPKILDYKSIKTRPVTWKAKTGP